MSHWVTSRVQHIEHKLTEMKTLSDAFDVTDGVQRAKGTRSIWRLYRSHNLHMCIFIRSVRLAEIINDLGNQRPEIIGCTVGQTVPHSRWTSTHTHTHTDLQSHVQTDDFVHYVYSHSIWLLASTVKIVYPFKYWQIRDLGLSIDKWILTTMNIDLSRRVARVDRRRLWQWFSTSVTKYVLCFDDCRLN